MMIQLVTEDDIACAIECILEALQFFEDYDGDHCDDKPLVSALENALTFLGYGE